MNSAYTRCYLIFTLLLSAIAVRGNDLDSLQQALESVDSDLDRVPILEELYRNTRNSSPPLALRYAQTAMDISRRESFNPGVAAALNNIGVIYMRQGDLETALNSFLEAMRIHQTINEPEEQAFTLGNIGTLYSIDRNFERALSYYQQSMDLFIQLGDSTRMVGMMNNLGNVYREQGLMSRALDKYEEAVELYDQLSDPSESFDPKVNIGDVYFTQGDYQQALNYYFESLKTEQKFNDVFQQANLLGNIGSVYKEMGRVNDALQYQQEAIELAKSINDKPLLILLYRNLSQTYLENDDLFSAYTYLNLSQKLKDSLFNQENEQRISDLETAFQFEKKEREIELLRKDNNIKDLEIKNDRTIMAATILFALLVLVLATMIYLRFMQSARAKAQLEEQNEEIRSMNDRLELQKKLVEEKNQHITESIEYAQAVQEAILNEKLYRSIFKNSFIFFSPKDLVSGDFYWISNRKDQILVAAIDCTGHGVAGAFMTVIGHALLDQIINQIGITQPADVLHELDKKLAEMMKRQDLENNRHGLDIALCKIDTSASALFYSGARRPLFRLRKGTPEEIKGERVNLGETNRPAHTFEETRMDLQSGDLFYLFSDGFADQFGGEENKKFMSKRFKTLLQDISAYPMSGQGQRLSNLFSEWKGNHEQTDDVLVLGFEWEG